MSQQQQQSMKTTAIGDALPKNCIPLNTTEKDISKLGHGDYVNHCLMVVLNHGYEVRMQGAKVEYNEQKAQIEYKPEQSLIDSLNKDPCPYANGGLNPGYPYPWNFMANQVIPWALACQSCGDRISSGVHMCAIANCQLRFTCSKIECAYKHYSNKHARI